MKKGIKAVFLRQRQWILLLIVPFIMLATACGNDEVEGGIVYDPVVNVMTVEKREIDYYRQYPARVRGAREVEVRARVQGILQEKRYDEGRLVEENDVLFLIDPEPYKIALQKAKAELTDASANFDSALRERDRYMRLYAQKAVSEQERDKAITDYELALARFERAEANLADARRNLRYTEVQAPVGGITGMESVSEGNLIEWGRLLTTITQIDPVHVHFSLPEEDALTHRFTINRFSGERRYRQVELILPDGTILDRKGDIDFTSSTIDPRTGTVTYRAVFSNPDKLLVPGQFVRVQMLLDMIDGAILVPETAISQVQESVRLFVVDDENIARERRVELGPVIEGRHVITAGLTEGDRVVVEGHVALRDGLKVSIEGQGKVPGSVSGDNGGEVR